MFEPSASLFVVELLKSLGALLALRLASPRPGVTLSELRSELASVGTCPPPAEVSTSVLALLIAFAVVGVALFATGLCLGLCLSRPLAWILDQRREQQSGAPSGGQRRAGLRGIEA